MDLSLAGKAAIIGGASQGIGFAIARVLAAEGARVAMVARRREPLDAAVGKIEGEACAIYADIRKADDCARIVASAVDRFGRVDIKITVNTICPGRIATGRLDKGFGAGDGKPQIDELALTEMAKTIPIGRLGTPQEIAGPVALLASPWGAYITGSTFHVDGGRHAALA